MTAVMKPKMTYIQKNESCKFSFLKYLVNGQIKVTGTECSCARLIMTSILLVDNQYVTNLLVFQLQTRHFKLDWTTVSNQKPGILTALCSVLLLL